MKRLFYGLLWLLNSLLLLYGVIVMVIELFESAEMRWAVAMAFGVVGLFILLLLWPVSRRLAQDYPMAFYLLGGLLTAAGLAGMIWMIVRPAVYSTLEVFGGWTVLMGGGMLASLPWLLKREKA